ncbi:MAG: sigma-54 dependent transcriptional regulator [Proteobacteria bacterium]|nr:sigma-54 dependent transcriptional regulator [Pseudomonadota bacterium]
MSHSDKRLDIPTPLAALSILYAEHSPSTLNESWLQVFPEIIGRSDAMMRVLETVSKIAKSDSAVLINGESGTGKELIARAIHRLSNRAPKPFLALNCSAIPENLLESQLFGHERGSFTGADKKHQGFFERAAGGTLFLDEIGDMAPSLQAKLLRVLQEKKFTPVGGKDLIIADVRIVTATHVNLDLAILNGSFRSDLYYRINVLPVTLPALRERPEDVALLLETFIENANRQHNPASPSFLDREVIDLLSKYRWPGNIRQLQNLVERLVVLRGGGRISVEHLPRDIVDSVNASIIGGRSQGAQPNSVGNAPGELIGKASQHNHLLPNLMPRPGTAPLSTPSDFGLLPPDGLNLLHFIELLENSLITQALVRTANNRNQAAKLLGMNRTTLVERIKKRKLTEMNPKSEEL